MNVDDAQKLVDAVGKLAAVSTALKAEIAKSGLNSAETYKLALDLEQASLLYRIRRVRWLRLSDEGLALERAVLALEGKR